MKVYAVYEFADHDNGSIWGVFSSLDKAVHALGASVNPIRGESGIKELTKDEWGYSIATKPLEEGRISPRQFQINPFELDGQEVPMSEEPDRA